MNINLNPQLLISKGSVDLLPQLGNLSFLFLLGSMILYWISLVWSDSSNKKYRTTVDFPSQINMKGEIAGDNLTVPRSFNIRSTSNKMQLVGHYGIIISNVLLFLLLCLRWKESGHFPLSNLYESLMFLSWCFTALQIFIEYSNVDLGSRLLYLKDNKNVNVSTTHRRPPGVYDTNLIKTENISLFIGAITTPSALFTNAFATITLPKEMQEAAPLVPALQSNWLMMHVTVMILSYAALIIGSLLSIAYLIVTSTVKRDEVISLVQTTPPVNNRTVSSVESLALKLDNLSYRILGLGFPFLTIGILSGAVWANEAWGSYWSWDPKETWALLTWLIFAIYLHTRLSSTTEGYSIPQKEGRNKDTEKFNKKPAIIASFGFVVVWICYLGVNLIGSGLHSYGWMSS